MVLMPGNYKMEEVWQHQNQWYTVKRLEYQPYVGHLSRMPVVYVTYHKSKGCLQFESKCS